MIHFHNKVIFNQFNRFSQLTIISIFLISCSFVSYFDAVSYKNLTDLKGEMKVAFETFSINGASGDKDLETFERFRVECSKGLEYEKGKSKNDDTVKQWEEINSLISEVVVRFKKDGENKLSPGYCKGKWKVLDTAFDIAIATENGKLEQ